MHCISASLFPLHIASGRSFFIYSLFPCYLSYTWQADTCIWVSSSLPNSHWLGWCFIQSNQIFAKQTWFWLLLFTNSIHYIKFSCVAWILLDFKMQNWLNSLSLFFFLLTFLKFWLYLWTFLIAVIAKVILLTNLHELVRTCLLSFHSSLQTPCGKCIEATWKCYCFIRSSIKIKCHWIKLKWLLRRTFDSINGML